MEHTRFFLCFLLFSISFIRLFIHSIDGIKFEPRNVKPLEKPPSHLLNATGLITYHGYKAKRYEAVTSDGYILGMTRIGECSGPPVLFINGLTIGPEIWVLHGPGHDLAFVLTDLGYDVWLGGQRGVLGSLGHIKLKYAQPQYWDFSFDEQGILDLPAMIDLILSESLHDKILYVGGSLGGTLLAIMCSQLPEYCSAVAGNVQFVPAFSFPRRKDLPLVSKINFEILVSIMAFVRRHQVRQVVAPRILRKIVKHFCENSIGENPCSYMSLQVLGIKKENIADGWLAYTLAEATSMGTSLNVLDHIIQLCRKGGLHMYDYGKDKNIEIYGSSSPPSYNLSKLSSPTAVIYSEIDIIVPKKIMLKALNDIGKLIYAKPIPDSTYGHAEVIIGKDLYKLIFNDVIDFLESIQF